MVRCSRLTSSSGWPSDRSIDSSPHHHAVNQFFYMVLSSRLCFNYLHIFTQSGVCVHICRCFFWHICFAYIKQYQLHHKTSSFELLLLFCCHHCTITTSSLPFLKCKLSLCTSKTFHVTSENELWWVDSTLENASSKHLKVIESKLM